MSDRRAVRPGERAEPRVERVGKLWRVRSLEAARQVLRARNQTTQAGFTAEFIPQGRLEHRPILISDGPAHKEQRSQVARFFAPVVVEERYGEQIAACADRLLGRAAGAGSLSLDDLALYYTVEVTAEIVGLTHRGRRDTEAARERRVRAMARRLVSFFDQPPFDLSRDDLGRRPRDWARAARKALLPIVAFHLFDVRPAIRQRRSAPRDDVISHLIRQGWSTTNILIEAVTYGTAGMVTTREFIAMAAWHLLTSPDLSRRYQAADAPERLAILQEIVRLEPVVGHLYRRAQQPFVVSDGDMEHRIEAGDLLDVEVRAVNADPRATPDPLTICPHRPVPSGVRPTVLTFSDGPHRCPGEPLALLEADVLLTRLLELRPRIVREPDLGWDDLVSGYELRGFRLALDG
ncbi:MAG TPA: cytochrome P450 [Propionibacteriaceae bacterium]|nr:cytochrome P450 [Propionibacteriaceae bacterium]